MKRYLEVFAIALVMCSGQLTAMAAPLRNLSGSVTDPKGTGLSKAEVLFHIDPVRRPGPIRRADFTTATDEQGRFSIRLEPGFYDMCVMAEGFSPSCKKIMIPANGTIEKYSVQLPLDPLITDHFADKF